MSDFLARNKDRLLSSATTTSFPHPKASLHPKPKLLLFFHFPNPVFYRDTNVSCFTLSRVLSSALPHAGTVFPGRNN